MDDKPQASFERPPPPLCPQADFSVPPPVVIELRKSVSSKTSDEKSTRSKDVSKRRRSRSKSRDTDRSRRSPHSSSRYSSRAYDFRRAESSRESSKRRRSRSRSRSRTSSHRSSSYRSSSRRSPHSSRGKSSRSDSRRLSPKRDARSTRESSKHSRPSKDPQTERERLLVKWRKNYCETSEQISKKLQEMANDEVQVSWIRSSPADIYYKRVKDTVVESMPRLDSLCTLFDEELLKRAEKAKTKQAPYSAPQRRRKIRACRHKCKFQEVE